MLRRATAQTIDPEGPVPEAAAMPDTPERRLLRAILHGAACELAYSDHRIRDEALDWFTYDGAEWGSVAHVAEVLGLDAGRLRRMAAEIVRRT